MKLKTSIPMMLLMTGTGLCADTLPSFNCPGKLTVLNGKAADRESQEEAPDTEVQCLTQPAL